MRVERIAVRLKGAAVGAVAAALALSAHAQPAPPQGVVVLSASASAELARDWITLTFSALREGSDAAAVQSALKQALEPALAQARRVERPGEIEVRTGVFALSPRYTNKGETNGWRGNAELIVQGRDMAAIAQLGGRITTMTIARVQHALSRQRRVEAEAEVTARAIANYRAKAADVTRHFGYASHVLREVSVSSLDQPPPMPMMRAQAVAMSSDESLPLQAGNETVSVTVQGSVQLLPAR